MLRPTPARLLPFALALVAAPPRADGPTFEADVQPILKASCTRCHGEKGKKGDLDLTSLAGLRKGGESGAVVVPRKVADSKLYELVHSGEMPPGKTKLSAKEVETLRRWIDAGAA